MSVEEAVKACYRISEGNNFFYDLKADFPAFKGHFETAPVLPAVCQMSFCADAARRMLNKNVEVSAVKRAKFIGPILPDMSLRITLTQRTDGFWGAELFQGESLKKLSQLILQFKERLV